MNTKLLYRVGACSLLGLAFLTACSHTSEKTTPSSDLPALTSDFTTTDFIPMNAKSGRFSIPVPSNWVASEVDTNNDFSAHSAGNEYFMTAKRYPKVDTPLSLEDFARSLLKNSQETKDEDVQLVPTSIADKSGFIFTKEVNKEKQLLLFFYEDGDEYRLISIVAHPDNKSKVQDFLIHAVGGWTTIDANQHAALDFSQAVTIPNASLTINIPASWAEVTEEVPADTTIFQDENNGIRLSIRGLSTTGYTVDLNQIADEIAPQDSAPNKEAVTIGSYQGYRVQFNQTSDSQSNYSVTIYVFHINNVLVTFTASAKVSDTPFLQATMETIISSMK